MMLMSQANQRENLLWCCPYFLYDFKTSWYHGVTRNHCTWFQRNLLYSSMPWRYCIYGRRLIFFQNFQREFWRSHGFSASDFINVLLKDYSLALEGCSHKGLHFGNVLFVVPRASTFFCFSSWYFSTAYLQLSYHPWHTRMVWWLIEYYNRRISERCEDINVPLIGHTPLFILYLLKLHYT